MDAQQSVQTENVDKTPDVLGGPAMHNAYFICHNVQVPNFLLVNMLTGCTIQDLLYFRGFFWPGAQKGKKGKKRKK